MRFSLFLDLKNKLVKVTAAAGCNSNARFQGSHSKSVLSGADDAGARSLVIRNSGTLIPLANLERVELVR